MKALKAAMHAWIQSTTTIVLFLSLMLPFQVKVGSYLSALKVHMVSHFNASIRISAFCIYDKTLLSILLGSNLCPSSVNAQNIVDLSSIRKSVEAEPELSDSASSVAKVPLEEITNNMKDNEHELQYVRKILLNKGLMSKDLGSYYLTSLAKTFDGTPFSNVHVGSRSKYTKEEVNIDKGMSKLLLDCVQECLELKHDHYFKAGYRAWAKGTSKVTRKDLAHEVYDEISGWKKMRNCVVDELVDNDMSTHLGRWVDFEIETFETGKQIQRQILSTLIDEILADFRIK